VREIDLESGESEVLTVELNEGPGDGQVSEPEHSGI
jgi:hypothetical protein